MTGKAVDNVDNNATGLLVLILPLALAIVVVLKAWPFLLILMALTIVAKVWQGYQWRKFAQEVNPFFTELIKDNQGCITPLDLSLKANLTAKAANRFLEKKAEEYGAQKKIYVEKGVVYYFLTASALGSIFADSDNLFELEESATSPQSSTSSEKFPQISTKEIADLGVEQASDSTPVEEIKTEDQFSSAVADSTKETPAPVVSATETQTPEIEEFSSTEETKIEETLSVDQEIISSEEEVSEDVAVGEEENSSSTEASEVKKLALIQTDLAKRLDINPSTVGRRKSDPDFALWSQSKDPEGLAWQYVPKTKMFVPIDLDS